MMINSIINEDDYIRETSEAIRQLLRRNELWIEEYDIEQNIRTITSKGYDIAQESHEHADLGRMYVHLQLLGPYKYFKDNGELIEYSAKRPIIDNIKWRITGGF